MHVLVIIGHAIDSVHVVPDGASVAVDGSRVDWEGGHLGAAEGTTLRARGGPEWIGWTLGADGAWVAPVAPEPDLATVRTAAVARLRASCAADIVGGFESAALGAPHRYPSATVDQINLMGSVTASLLPGVGSDWSTLFWCADDGGAWAFRPHSAGQIQQVGADGKAHVVVCQRRLDELTAAVTAAETAEAVAAITWED